MSEIKRPDLECRTAEILDEVRHGREEYIVTEEGRPIAHLSPVRNEATLYGTTGPVDEEKAWQGYLEVVEEAHQARPEGWRTQNVLDEIRSLDANTQDKVSSLWAREAESRIDAYEQGKMSATPSEEVFAALRSRTRGGGVTL